MKACALWNPEWEVERLSDDKAACASDGIEEGNYDPYENISDTACVSHNYSL